MKKSKARDSTRSSAMRALLVSSGMCSALYAPVAGSVELDTGNPDIKMRWDNTFKYSAAARVRGQAPALLANINGDDGDRNLDKGLISNRVDLFSEFDITYKDFGARVTGAAWYDRVYNQATDNGSPRTANGVGNSYNEFSRAARKVHGRNGELLDAFVFGKGELGTIPASFRFGKYSSLWGETLFFGNNGMAGTMAGTDIVKALSVPGSQFKEIVRPDRQISAQFALTSEITVGGYYKFSWEANRFPVSGSYFANDDILFGGERVLLPIPLPNGGYASLKRVNDYTPKDTGQGGLQFKWHPDDLDLGFYVTRYHDRAPSAYAFLGTGANPAIGQLGVYDVAYAQGITAYGVSASKSVGDIVLNAELSTRHNTSLVASRPILVPVGVAADNDNNPRYPIGNTAHANFSFIWGMGPNAIAQEASFLGELAWNRRLSVSRNPEAVLNTSERDAWGLRLSYAPSYRQALPGVDLTVNTTASYFPKGNSSAFNGFGVDNGGDMSVGLEATYLDSWKGSVSFTHYYGNKILQPGSIVAQQFKDRDFISLSLRRTF
ncbi:Protein of unknown function [Duganella sp. CF517]|uniref:DUF1302 domain-containing protein n=1 Tax=Duganella sp. CF517 TaxID=1881038 RepID=UPI0008D71497|nr:DUF1302 family protein [Duganella sp. CF517]SEO09333.1 Protein of unknown function [Duganella sp. CF517]